MCVSTQAQHLHQSADPPPPYFSPPAYSRFNPGFYNSGGSKPGQIAYGSNVKRTACMTATKDGECEWMGAHRPGCWGVLCGCAGV